MLKGGSWKVKKLSVLTKVMKKTYLSPTGAKLSLSKKECLSFKSQKFAGLKQVNDVRPCISQSVVSKARKLPDTEHAKSKPLLAPQKRKLAKTAMNYDPPLEKSPPAKKASRQSLRNKQ